jgi:hypothetical protein
MAIQPNQPQSIGGVLDTVFQLYKVSLSRVLPVTSLAALTSIPAAFYTIRMTLQLQNATDVEQVKTVALAMFADPTYYIMVLVGLLAKLWLFAAMVLQMSAIGKDEELPVKVALAQGVRPVPSLFVAWILYFIIVTVGSILFVVPGIIFSVSLLLALCILQPLEGKGPFSALKASHELVWGCWWRTTGILSVGLIIIIVAFSGLGLVFTVAGPLLGVSVVVQTASSSIVGIVLTLLLSPLYVSMLLCIYWDLKLRKQGTDLEARVGALGARA